MQSRADRHIVRAVLFAFLLALPAAAQPVRDQMLVSTEWLQRNSRDVTILHVGDQADYDAGHIPGAVLVEKSSLLVQREDNPNELPPVSALEDVFRAAGVGSRGRIVVYSLDPLLAARTWFTLDYLGHGHRASLLDGGLTKWLADGCAASLDPVVAGPGSFEARVVPGAVTRLATMRELVHQRARFSPNLIVIDARPPAQFAGKEPGTDVRRAGHIPGAINVPASRNFAEDGTLLPREELRALYRRTGVSGISANIVYCRTGMQASVTYFVLEYLGYDAVLYDGSYLEWSNEGEIIESVSGLEMRVSRFSRFRKS